MSPTSGPNGIAPGRPAPTKNVIPTAQMANVLPYLLEFKNVALKVSVQFAENATSKEVPATAYLMAEGAPILGIFIVIALGRKRCEWLVSAFAGSTHIERNGLVQLSITFTTPAGATKVYFLGFQHKEKMEQFVRTMESLKKGLFFFASASLNPMCASTATPPAPPLAAPSPAASLSAPGPAAASTAGLSSAMAVGASVKTTSKPASYSQSEVTLLPEDSGHISAKQQSIVIRLPTPTLVVDSGHPETLKPQITVNDTLVNLDSEDEDVNSVTKPSETESLADLEPYYESQRKVKDNTEKVSKVFSSLRSRDSEKFFGGVRAAFIVWQMKSHPDVSPEDIEKEVDEYMKEHMRALIQNTRQRHQRYTMGELFSLREYAIKPPAYLTELRFLPPVFPLREAQREPLPGPRAREYREVQATADTSETENLTPVDLSKSVTSMAWVMETENQPVAITPSNATQAQSTSEADVQSGTTVTSIPVPDPAHPLKKSGNSGNTGAAIEAEVLGPSTHYDELRLLEAPVDGTADMLSLHASENVSTSQGPMVDTSYRTIHALNKEMAHSVEPVTARVVKDLRDSISRLSISDQRQRPEISVSALSQASIQQPSEFMVQHSASVQRQSVSVQQQSASIQQQLTVPPQQPPIGLQGSSHSGQRLTVIPGAGNGLQNASAPSSSRSASGQKKATPFKGLAASRHAA